MVKKKTSKFTLIFVIIVILSLIFMIHIAVGDTEAPDSGFGGGGGGAGIAGGGGSSYGSDRTKDGGEDREKDRIAVEEDRKAAAREAKAAAEKAARQKEVDNAINQAIAADDQVTACQSSGCAEDALHDQKGSLEHLRDLYEQAPENEKGDIVEAMQEVEENMRGQIRGQLGFTGAGQVNVWEYDDPNKEEVVTKKPVTPVEPTTVDTLVQGSIDMLDILNGMIDKYPDQNFVNSKNRVNALAGKVEKALIDEIGFDDLAKEIEAEIGKLERVRDAKNSISAHTDYMDHIAVLAGKKELVPDIEQVANAAYMATAKYQATVVTIGYDENGKSYIEFSLN